MSLIPTQPATVTSPPSGEFLDTRDIIKTDRREPCAGRGLARVNFSRYKANSLFLPNLGQKGGEGVVIFLALLFAAVAAQGQGILTVTPTRTTSTVAGNGTASYTGDSGAATSATVAHPGAVAYDTAGNLYIADTNNHVIREVSKSGTITTIAGTGIEGFSGDGTPATAAQLDTPTGIAVDSSGNVYIADSHNHRIRRIAAGTITTVAGTGVAGFSGDGAAATSAKLALPSGVAVDASGNLYIADTNNHRIREVSNGNIATIAGDGEELYAGDGSPATAAALDSPTGVAVSSTGTVYIADRLNQRIRAFTVGGTISTVAGSGAASFAGGFSGDGSSATASTLARPTGVSVDAAGNVYVADTGNQRIRELVNGGAITTIVGSGAQGFGGDGGAATSAILNVPKSVAPDALGNLAIADTLDHRIRSGTLPALTFANTAVGVASASQSVTLTNTGTASLSVSPIFGAGYTAVAGGTCNYTAPNPINLAGGASCTQNIAFLPVAAGPDAASVVYSGVGVVPQTILLSGTATAASTTVQLVSNLPTPLNGQTVLFTATVSPSGAGNPTGTVSFYDGTNPIAQNVALSGTSASFSTAALADGTHSLTAVYSGDTNFSGGTSAPLNQLVEDFQLTVSGVAVQSVIPGKSATFSGLMQSSAGPFSYPIVLSLTGLPTGAIATFNPPSVTLAGTPVPVSVTIQTPATASIHYPHLLGGTSATLALLLLPFSRRLRRKARRLRFIVSLCWVAGLCSLMAVTGCGLPSGLFGQQPQTYTIGLVGTATGSNGATLQRNINVTLTIQ